jgi:hypothetical protein
LLDPLCGEPRSNLLVISSRNQLRKLLLCVAVCAFALLIGSVRGRTGARSGVQGRLFRMSMMVMRVTMNVIPMMTQIETLAFRVGPVLFGEHRFFDGRQRGARVADT